MISLIQDRRFSLSVLLIMLFFWLSASVVMPASLPNNPILYRETGGSRAYLHELEFPVGSTTKTTTGTGRNTWSKVKLNFAYEILTVPTHNFQYIGTILPITLIGNYTDIGQAMYIDPNFRANAADADQTTTMPCIGIVATTGYVLIQGIMRNNAWAWTRGPIYVSCDPATTTGLTQTAPSGTTDQVQAVGYAIDPNVIMIQPDSILKAIP